MSAERKERDKFGRTLIAVNHVSITHGSEDILRDVSFDIKEGEALALVGPNGAGKTTLIRIILGEETPGKGEVVWAKGTSVGYVPQFVGEIDTTRVKTVKDFFFHGKGLLKIREEMNMIESQFSESTYSEESIAKYGVLQQEFETKGGWNIETDARIALNGIGLSEIDLDQTILTLSGGEKTKIFLAQALVTNPDILILDEPTNHLDARSIEWLQTYLKSYKGAVLVVSHSPQFLDTFVNGVVELRLDTRGADEYSGNYTQYLEQRAERELAYRRTVSRQAREVDRQIRIIASLRGGVRAATAKSREKKLERIRGVAGGAPLVPKKGREVNIRFDILQESGKEVLVVSGLKKHFGDLTLDYTPVSLSIQKGENIIVIGPEGAGKSTFLKLICGDFQPDEGSIKYGTNVSIGYYRQEHEDLNPDNTVFEELRRTGMNISDGRLRAILGHFLFPGESIHKKVGVLSQGEKSRLALAKLVLGNYNFLVLDEPTNHLDIASKKRLAEALSGFRGTLLIVSHDEEFIELLNFDRALILPEGEIELL